MAPRTKITGKKGKKESHARVEAIIDAIEALEKDHVSDKYVFRAIKSVGKDVKKFHK